MIPKMTKKEKCLWVKALQELLDWYTGRTTQLGSCPLCGVYKSACESTHRCPWYWFTGNACNIYAEKEFNEEITCLRLDLSNKRWVNLRKKQIPQWTKKIENG